MMPVKVGLSLQATTAPWSVYFLTFLWFSANWGQEGCGLGGTWMISGTTAVAGHSVMVGLLSFEVTGVFTVVGHRRYYSVECKQDNVLQEDCALVSTKNEFVSQ
jgi:hypothetical protein